MSTILKALRRLEEEDSKGGAAKSKAADVVASDVASGVLRDRILAEEAAAEALSPDSSSDGHRSQKLVVTGVAAVAIFLLAVGAIWFLESNGAGPTSPGISEDAAPERFAAVETPSTPLPRVAPNPPAPRPMPRRAPLPAPRPEPEPIAVAASTPVAESANARPTPRVAPTAVPAPAPAPTQQAKAPAPAPLEMAAVTPTAAVKAAPRRVRDISALPEASAESPANETKSRTSRASRSTEKALAPPKSAPMPTPESRPIVKTSPSAATVAALSPAGSPPETRDAEMSSTPPSLAEANAAGAPAVERIDDRGMPDVVVLRTSWHPLAERRSARLRVVASEEVLTLREGDAVGGLVIREITPSSVLFQAGGVEVRRKVGATH